MKNHFDKRQRRKNNDVKNHCDCDIDLSLIPHPAEVTVNCEHRSPQHNIALSWRDLSVTVKIPGKRALRGESTPSTERVILKNVTGHAAPGCLLAIMGASGSGKSTLLNVLTSRNTKDYILSGEVLLNGVQISDGMRDISAYVQQSDLFIHTLTVREQLQFRALLRMDRRLNKKARLTRVEEVIVEMGLSGCADSRIGNPSGANKGISGGERKRLSFASEALTNPPVFFCDEPTSSLDTFMAQSIVNTLKKMAAHGRVILCTIHQPSSELFALFNQVLLLADGRVAYIGSTESALEFFSGLEYPCPLNFNPADHYILTLAIVPGEEEHCKQKTSAICDTFAKSQHAEAITGIITNLVQNKYMTAAPIAYMKGTGESRYNSSIGVQCKNLLWRSWTAQFRDTMLFRVRVGQTFCIGLILGLSYLQLKVDQKGVMNITGALFLLIVNICLTNLFSVLTSFPGEMAIVMREYGTGLYGMAPYFITKTVAETPLIIMLTLMFGSCTYWMIGLREDFEAFAVMILVLVMVSMISVAVGYIISIICGNTTLALSVATPVMMPFLLFAGLFLNGDDVPKYFIWLEAISWFKYSFEIAMVNQWNVIEEVECVRPNMTGVANLTMEQLCISQTCQYRSGNDVLRYNSLDKDDLLLDYAALGALAGAGYFIAFIALLIRANRSRD